MTIRLSVEDFSAGTAAPARGFAASARDVCRMYACIRGYTPTPDVGVGIGGGGAGRAVGVSGGARAFLDTPPIAAVSLARAHMRYNGVAAMRIIYFL